MRKVILILLVFISAKVNAQVYQEMPQYGYRANRMAFDSTLQIPTVCGVPTLKSIVKANKNGAIAYDSCNAIFYTYNPKTLTWSALSGGGGGSTDTTSLSNRINLKLNISDTASMLNPYLRKIDTTNKFVNRITRTEGKDSIIYFVGANRFAIKDSIGVAGSGTQNFVPKWSNSTTLQNSQIFDSVNVGINTTTPAYKLDVNGEINTNQGIRIGTNGAKTGFYGGANIIDFFAGENKISTWGLTAVGGSYFDYFPSFTYNTGDAGITNILKIRGNATSNSANNAGVTQLDISPTYTQQTFGTGTLRGIYYNPSLASGGINTSKHIAFESASGNVVMKGLKTSSSTTDSIAIWINDTLSKAPYPSGVQIDTTLFQRKQIPSYTFLANNTTATANAQALPFKDTSGTYTGTITWNGTAPTSGTFTYRWTRIGKMVTINISLVYANAGSANSTIVIGLPSDAPTPTKPAGLTSASNLLYPCYGGVNITNQSTLTNAAFRGFLRNNSANNGFEFTIAHAATTAVNAFVTCTYFTD